MYKIQEMYTIPVGLSSFYGEFEMINNHASIVSNLKKGRINVYGNITLDNSEKEIFEKGDRGYHLDITSGTVEMNNNKVTALVE